MDTGVTHLMCDLGHFNYRKWFKRCDDRFTIERRTRPGEIIDCMMCLSCPDHTERLYGQLVKVSFARQNHEEIHEAWTINDFEGMTTCGIRFDLYSAQQTTCRVSCRLCHR